MLVQRDNETIAHGTSSATITLDTPVPVGKSFALVHANNEYADTIPSTLCRAELRTEVNGEYTELRISRQVTTGEIDVHWQVVSGDVFTVQTGETSLTGTSTTVNISEVDLDEAFIILTFSPAQDASDSVFVAAEFSSNSQIELRRNSTTGDVSIRWYVIEWDGAVVESGEDKIDNYTNVKTVGIDTIDQDEAFLIYSARTSIISRTPDRVLVRGHFSDDDEIEFRRHSDADFNHTICWFVVTVPGEGNVQGGTGSGDGSVNVGISAVELDRTFVPMIAQGNNYVSFSTNTMGTRGYHRQRLTSSTNLNVINESSKNFAYFVVEAEEPKVGPFPTFFRQ